MQCRRTYTRKVEELLSQIAPSPAVLNEIYSRITSYNRPMPVHEGTGVRYTYEERKVMQRENLLTLQELAELRRVNSSIRFHIAQRVKISRSVNGRPYNPRRL
jgi:hypothetical protein